MAEQLDVADRNPQFYYAGPYRTFVNKAYFVLEDIGVIHPVLGNVIWPLTGGVATSFLGICFPILAHFRWMREKAVPAPAPEPTTPPMRAPSPGGSIYLVG